jgi:glycerol-3-phosphate dehydrogenase
LKREPDRLRQGPFDLLVVGGGIYGAWTAYDAASRGMRVALVERDDWGSATSSASSKLIHGGLRYLEQRRLGLVRRGLEERKKLWRLGPHRMLRLRFVMPLYEGGRVGPWRMRLGLWLYDRLAGRRQPVPPHTSLGRAELLKRYAFLNPAGLVAGFTFGDLVTDDARYTLEIVDGALQAGAAAVNRAAARELLIEDGQVAGARIEDGESGERIEVRAAVTVVCAGPWSAELVEQAGGTLRTRCSKGVHLVMPPLPGKDALLLPSDAHGGVVFLIPWYGRTLLGTTDQDYTGRPGDLRVEPAEVRYLLDQANRALAGPGWTEADIVSSFAGLRVLPATDDVSPATVSRDLEIEEPLERLIAPVGGKLTSARADAVKIVDRALHLQGMSRRSTPSESQPFPWRPSDRYRRWSRGVLAEALELGIDEETALNCRSRYGARIEQLFLLVQQMPRLAKRIVEDAPFCFAELVYAAQHEMVHSLEDILRRRVPLLLVSPPSERRLLVAAQIVGKVLQWSEKRTREEATALLRSARSSPPVHEPG